MAKGKTSIWKTILQIALAAMLIVGGCNVFFGNFLTKLTSSDELITAVSSLFNGDLRKIVVYVLTKTYCSLLSIQNFKSPIFVFNPIHYV